MTGSRLITGGRLVIASHNRGKVDEFAALLAPFNVQAVSAADLGLPEPIESGATFAANAEIKASSAARHSGLPAMADDSGLVVAALGGAPGILSARWAGSGRDFVLAMKKVEDELKGANDRRAHFACALSLVWPDGHSRTFQGEVPGRLVWPPRGDHGFGYDPMFVADGQDITFGEMEPQAKHAISHRAVAFGKLAAACLER